MTPRATDYFINDGFGWECKACRPTDTTETVIDGLPRFYREGEAEHKETQFTQPARARWRDAAQQILYCPRCHAEESISQI